MSLIINQRTWRPTSGFSKNLSVLISPCIWLSVKEHGAQRQLLLLKQALFPNIKKKDSNTKRTSFCPDTSTMSRSLLNKRHSQHGDQRLRASCQKKTWEVPRPCRLKIYQVQKKIQSLQNLDLDFFSLQNKRERILKKRGDLAMLHSLHGIQLLKKRAFLFKHHKRK